MSPQRIHQMTANLVYGDAVTNDVLEIDRLLKSWGLNATIYAESAESRLGGVSRPTSAYEPYLADREDVLLYHYSIYSDNLQQYRRSHNRKVVIYHNITPPEYFQDFDPHLATLCRFGRASLAALSDCDIALAVSEYNLRDLIAAGVPAERAFVRPVSLDLVNLAEAPVNGELARQLRTTARVNLLSVGRLAPNKRCDDLIKVAYAYHRYIDPSVHLWLVGNRSFRTYVKYVAELISRLDLNEVVTVTDRVSRGDLRTYYENSDVFLSASCHEGFGVPLIESMTFDLPILARAAAAVPETLGDAGILIREWKIPEIAELLRIVVSDGGLRTTLKTHGKHRVAQLTREKAEAPLRGALERLGVL